MTEEFLPFSRPCIEKEDIDAVVAVLQSGWITTGPVNQALETRISQWLGDRHVVAVSSATAAIDLYLSALGIGPGDEVITPSLTWVSVPNLVQLRGATPVFVDVDRDDLMTTAKHIEAAITTRTKLIVPVHYAGAPLDVDAIHALGKMFGIPVLDDAAHALGTSYKNRLIGSEGDAFFSFQAIKNVTGAEGGVFVTGDADLSARIRRLRFHGLGSDTYGRETQGRSTQAQVLEPGYKYNLPDMNAALALSQFDRLKEINNRRRFLAGVYDELLSEIQELTPLKRPAYAHEHAWHLYIVRVESARINRNEFIEAMQQEGHWRRPAFSCRA